MTCFGCFHVRENSKRLICPKICLFSNNLEASGSQQLGTCLLASVVRVVRVVVMKNHVIADEQI